MHKVLIVDDEQRTLDGVALRVKNSGFDVCIAGLAHDGTEALELTRVHQPGIILCDIRMPGMDGIAFTLKAKQIDPDIAVIFMSGYSDREYLKTAIRIGAIDYLDKPVDEDQFMEALERAIRRRDAAVGKQAMQAFDQETLRLLLVCNNEDIIRQASNVSLYAHSEYIIIVAILSKHDYNDDTEQQFSMFTLHMISSFSEEQHYRYATIKMGNQIILLVKDEHSGAGQSLEQRVGDLCSAMLIGLPEAQEHISIGIGCRFNRLIDTSRSYRLACEALELTFFRGIGLVVSHGDIKGSQYKLNESQFYDIDVFCENYELLRVTETVERIYQKFTENEKTPVTYIKSITLRLFQILAQNYEKEFMEGLLENPVTLQKIVMTAFTIEQLTDILGQLIGKYTNAILTMDKKNSAIYSAKKYIWKHLDDDLSIKSIARTVYLAPTYLCALFKEVTGITINQYVQHVRMDKAKTLLINTSHTINEISDMVGYKNAGYFSRTFIHYAGTSPTLFRKMHSDD